MMSIDWSDKTTAASDCANWRRIVDQCSTQNGWNYVQLLAAVRTGCGRNTIHELPQMYCSCGTRMTDWRLTGFVPVMVIGRYELHFSWITTPNHAYTKLLKTGTFFFILHKNTCYCFFFASFHFQRKCFRVTVNLSGESATDGLWNLIFLLTTNIEASSWSCRGIGERLSKIVQYFVKLWQKLGVSLFWLNALSSIKTRQQPIVRISLMSNWKVYSAAWEGFTSSGSIAGPGTLTGQVTVSLLWRRLYTTECSSSQIFCVFHFAVPFVYALYATQYRNCLCYFLQQFSTILLLLLLRYYYLLLLYYHRYCNVFHFAGVTRGPAAV